MIQDCLMEVLKVAAPVVIGNIVKSINGDNIKPLVAGDLKHDHHQKNNSPILQANTVPQNQGITITLNVNTRPVDDERLVKPITYYK